MSDKDQAPLRQTRLLESDPGGGVPQGKSAADPDPLLDQLAVLKREVMAAVQVFSESVQLRNDPDGDLTKLEKNLQRLRTTLGAIEQAPAVARNLNAHIRKELERLPTLRKERQMAFGSSLQALLSEMGIPLSGQYPLLRAGLFTIELQFNSDRASIWYGQKQELLSRCRISPKEVASAIRRQKERLGHGRDVGEFMHLLKLAYDKTPGHERGEPLPIGSVLAQLIQEIDLGSNTPKRKGDDGYGRADFSFDLYRSKRSDDAHHLRLTVATKAYTRRREDFLWVPETELGQGTTYSHILIRG